MSKRYTVGIPLLDEHHDHLERLVKETGAKRYQIMRAALMAFKPNQMGIGVEVARRAKETTELRATVAALRENGGVITRAAAALGIGYVTMYKRVKRWGLQDLVVRGRRGRPRLTDEERAYRRRKSQEKYERRHQESRTYAARKARQQRNLCLL